MAELAWMVWLGWAAQLFGSHVQPGLVGAA